MSKYSNNGGFDSSRWIRDFKNKSINEKLNDPALKKLRTLAPGTKFPPINTWWEAQPKDLMGAVYHSKGMLPPSDPAKFEKAYNDIVQQLHKMYPIPANILPKLDLDDETEKAISMDAPGMNEARPMASGPMVSGIEFQPGDMWSNDFDYVGMLKYSAAMEIPEDPNALLAMVELLNKLFDSYEDVNYHSEARDLGIAIDYIEDSKGIEDLERAQDLLANHQKAAAKTLKDITRR